ncbi:MAG TPA: type II secretion system protein [Candidatus Norongarragalinales archaeon]|nr:type II secretion system protein [Candidatus Norongarragalinales archaeon]
MARQKAQTSLEVLIVMAALLVSLAVVLPSFLKIEELAIMAQKEKRMEFSIGKIQSALQEAQMLGNGAATLIEVDLPFEMVVRSNGGNALFEYGNPGAGRAFEMEGTRIQSSPVIAPEGKTTILVGHGSLKALVSSKKG